MIKQKSQKNRILLTGRCRVSSNTPARLSAFRAVNRPKCRLCCNTRYTKTFFTVAIYSNKCWGFCVTTPSFEAAHTPRQRT